MFDWMVWTTPVAVFFSCIALMLAVMTVWEIKSPTVVRKGFLPIATTRGDRLFMGLLAAGYINNLYMLLGDEARADAANPTIGIGTKDSTYGEIATSIFSFQGQVPSLLEEELALLRGRADFLQPAVTTPPYYNRLVWNYTRGINSGEVIYALNYDILDKNSDGVVDGADAAILYPQGHGDAYGHYLTALTGFYSLLMNNHFDWVPATESVNPCSWGIPSPIIIVLVVPSFPSLSACLKA